MSMGRAVVVSAVAVLGLGSAACSSGSAAKPSATVTVTSSATVKAGGASATLPSAAASLSPSAAPSPTSSTTLHGDCSSILPLTAVDKAVGASVPGKTAFIVNLPDSTIGQVERVNCQYGVTAAVKGKKTPPPVVEVSVSLYASNGAAAKRIAATEEQWRQNSAAPHAVQVGGHGGTVLVGYGDPLLVIAVGPRTVAASVAPSVATAASRDRILTALAAAALRGAGG